jgi:hypothetical protein
VYGWCCSRSALTSLVQVKCLPPDEQQAVLVQESDLQALPQHGKLHQTNRTLGICCLLLLQVRAVMLRLLPLLLLVPLIVNPCVPGAGSKLYYSRIMQGAFPCEPPLPRCIKRVWKTCASRLNMRQSPTSSAPERLSYLHSCTATAVDQAFFSTEVGKSGHSSCNRECMSPKLRRPAAAHRARLRCAVTKKHCLLK